MTRVDILKTLENSGSIHRGCQLTPPAPCVDSGFTELNQVLGGGFPQFGVCKLRSQPGSGEVRLLMPYIKNRVSNSAPLVLINPPGPPQPDFWQAQELSAPKLLSLSIPHKRDLLWSIQECLQSGCCPTLLVWNCSLSSSECKRLQLAAYKGTSTLWLCGDNAQASVPLTLSLSAEPRANGISVMINKRKGGWPAGPIDLTWQAQWPDLCTERQGQTRTRPTRAQKWH
ncbi:hypothetical protein [Gilvimarinus sp. DA14]|uniref:hypothetical protein n=1 Tax=Gilvimarinus sp. DA14 TaxID=2956798 RepID=UPI0020B7FF83|nr:hypothetical protein [Gilvimarinus sp. DA14]UTF60515.1 hypothetical protein NHM04_01590 [Gilvimarinus sp. DA14]